MRRLQRRPDPEQEEYGRPTEYVCSVCGGLMVWRIVPCQDPYEAAICTQVHFGYRCSFCERVVSEIEAGPEESPNVEAGTPASNLRSGDWNG